VGRVLSILTPPDVLRDKRNGSGSNKKRIVVRQRKLQFVLLPLTTKGSLKPLFLRKTCLSSRMQT